MWIPCQAGRRKRGTFHQFSHESVFLLSLPFLGFVIKLLNNPMTQIIGLGDLIEYKRLSVKTFALAFDSLKKLDLAYKILVENRTSSTCHLIFPKINIVDRRNTYFLPNI
jgi:hypothetical protein